MKNTLILTLAGSALLMASATSNAATIATQTATLVDNAGNTTNSTSDGSVGNGGDNNRRAFGIFKVSDVLTQESLTFVDLATTTFSFSFGTAAGSQLSTGGVGDSYRVASIGFFQNLVWTEKSTASPDSGWEAVRATQLDPNNFLSFGGVDTGIADTLAAQTISRKRQTHRLYPSGS